MIIGLCHISHKGKNELFILLARRELSITSKRNRRLSLVPQSRLYQIKWCLLELHLSYHTDFYLLIYMLNFSLFLIPFTSKHRSHVCGRDEFECFHPYLHQLRMILEIKLASGICAPCHLWTNSYWSYRIHYVARHNWYRKERNQDPTAAWKTNGQVCQSGAGWKQKRWTTDNRFGKRGKLYWYGLFNIFISTFCTDITTEWEQGGVTGRHNYFYSCFSPWTMQGSCLHFAKSCSFHCPHPWQRPSLL